MTGLEALTQLAIEGIRQKKPKATNVKVWYNSNTETWYAELGDPLQYYTFPILNGDDDAFCFVNVIDPEDKIEISIPEDVLEEIVYRDGTLFPIANRILAEAIESMEMESLIDGVLPTDDLAGFELSDLSAVIAKRQAALVESIRNGVNS